MKNERLESENNVEYLKTDKDKSPNVNRLQSIRNYNKSITNRFLQFRNTKSTSIDSSLKKIPVDNSKRTAKEQIKKDANHATSQNKLEALDSYKKILTTNSNNDIVMKSKVSIKSIDKNLINKINNYNKQTNGSNGRSETEANDLSYNESKVVNISGNEGNRDNNVLNVGNNVLKKATEANDSKKVLVIANSNGTTNNNINENNLLHKSGKIASSRRDIVHVQTETYSNSIALTSPNKISKNYFLLLYYF